MAREAWRMPGYRVEELLGTGSSGEVWRGRVSATGAGVALKRIWLSDVAQRRAALSEAAMLSSLEHPHLMKLHELRHVDDDAIVLVLELASSGSLASLLARRGRLTVGETITAIAPVAAALAYAHHCGIVHGDVSSANILFTDVGLPLLADLGVARLLGDALPVRTTPAYIDPAVAGGALPTPASDIFMLGAVALHALTGSPPWPGTVPADVLDAATSGAPADFAGRLAAAGVPQTTAAVIARALGRDPAQRGTAADLALDLRHSGEPVAVELSAGRSRVAPSLHAVVGSGAGRVESWPLDSMPLDSMRSGSTPSGSMPIATSSTPSEVLVVPFASEQPPTDSRRASSRSSSTAGARHLARSGPRVATGFAACALMLAMAAGATIWWWPFSGGGHHRGVEAASAPSASSVARTVRQPTPEPTPTPTPTRAKARMPAVLDLARARSVLAELDATRAAAFAKRDPALLAMVYASPSLLARDRALLTAVVPSGCGLRGVHTRFTRLSILAHVAAQTRLRVDIALGPSTLVCSGTPSGRAAAAPTSAVQIDLVRVGSRYRIAGQRRV